MKKQLEARGKGRKDSVVGVKIKTTKTGRNRRRSTVELSDAKVLQEDGATTLPPI